MTEPLWSGHGVFLDTATYGLPPRPAWEALQSALEEWRQGAGRWEDWVATADRCRGIFARLVSVDVDQVSIGATVSEFVGLVAAALPRGSCVVAPTEEFTSVLFPFLAHAGRGVETQLVPLAELADAIDVHTTLVAVSAVQSSTGTIADLDRIIDAARAHNALVLVDGTQACGWLSLDASRVDFLVCAGYKWLMAPRGVAFMSANTPAAHRLRPLSPGWFAGRDPYASFYGGPLRLADTARRLDTSPAWHCWVGAEPALRVVEDIGVSRIGEHNVAMANRFCAGLGIAPANSAIVTFDIARRREVLEHSAVRLSMRGGRARASFHIYTTTDHVDLAVEILRPMT
jgi:selenocysteine lyase/cysteine desulfurase